MTEGLLLPDVNVLVAFLWPQHIFHATARQWFVAARERGWATCPITEMGCVRVLASPALPPGNLTVTASADRLREFLADERPAFWPADLPLGDSAFAASLPHIQGPRQITDRYLLALAAAHDGTFATFDRALAAGLPANSPLLDHLEVIPVVP